MITLCAAVVGLAACGDQTVIGPDGREVSCDLPDGLLQISQPPDGIPALTAPVMVSADDPEAGYLFDSDRVLGVVVDGKARAYPHNIFWWHEIVNDSLGDGKWVSTTFCPLTGSGLSFDPGLPSHRLELGVSGMLFANNLVMFDRQTGALYGPQLSKTAKCSAFAGEALEVRPVQETSWGRWKELHPDTRVVSGDTGFPRNYRTYPYGNYDLLASDELLFPMDVDDSRPIKERVLAIRVGEKGGRGYPFGELAELGPVAAVNEEVGGRRTVVLYEARNGATAIAFEARIGSQELTFEVDGAGGWTDQETGSTWRIDGLAVDGPLAGEQLPQIADSYVLMWFAWRHFNPEGTNFES